MFPLQFYTFYSGPQVNAPDLSDVNVSLALEMANSADVIVLCLGEGTYAEKPGI
jgi:hypothetical protein